MLHQLTDIQGQTHPVNQIPSPKEIQMFHDEDTSATFEDGSTTKTVD